MTTTKVTAAGIKTLKTVAANGGEMNSWAGQRGFNAGATRDKLIKDGHLARVADCGTCATRNDGDGHDTPCVRPLDGQKSGRYCYLRVRITDAGRAAIA